MVYLIGIISSEDKESIKVKLVPREENDLFKWSLPDEGA